MNNDNVSVSVHSFGIEYNFPEMKCLFSAVRLHKTLFSLFNLDILDSYIQYQTEVVVFLSTAVTETLLRLSNVLLISVLLIQVSSYAQISGLQDGIWFAVL